MSNCQIIEDCSPYYIRYKFDGLEKLIELCKSYPLPDRSPNFSQQFLHINVGQVLGQQMIDTLPFADKIDLNMHRASLFLAEPGFYYGAHKDGFACKVSFNFTVSILDDKCVTSWYSDDDLADYEISNFYVPSLDFHLPQHIPSREVLNWDRTKHVPIKSTVFRPNEAVLLNTDIFHTFDNSQSNNRRLILTLRPRDPSMLSLEQVKDIIFDS